ncbi:hypothetical protein [Sphingobium sp. EM0848]|uniref:hypothetical protein n=1 Tax=Sphingobium sp. EM0848 TaxID=2743473 RepID=UPI00159C6F3A|nr:hypothetical protein [Sphingobium sp. EM0848]
MELEALLEQFQVVANRSGSMMLGSFRCEPNESPALRIELLNHDETFRLIEKTRPPIIYPNLKMTNARSQIAESLTDLEYFGLVEDEAIANEIREAAKVLEPYEGRIGQLVISFLVGAALHTFAAGAPWLVEFNMTISEIMYHHTNRMAGANDEPVRP